MWHMNPTVHWVWEKAFEFIFVTTSSLARPLSFPEACVNMRGRLLDDLKVLYFILYPYPISPHNWILHVLSPGKVSDLLLIICCHLWSFYASCVFCWLSVKFLCHIGDVVPSFPICRFIPPATPKSTVLYFLHQSAASVMASLICHLDVFSAHYVIMWTFLLVFFTGCLLAISHLDHHWCTPYLRWRFFFIGSPLPIGRKAF